MSKFSERLNELITDKNLSPEELGQKIGFSGRTIRHWLNDEHSVFRSQLIKLAIYFNCPIDFIAGRIDFYNDFSHKECPPFIEQLYKVLNERGVSTYKLNKDTSIKFSYLTRYRRGTEPHLYSLIELADYLNCSIDYLIGFEAD